MRLDLFLKASRLCLRRTVAQKLCDAGLVSINGKPAKSAHVVNPGDEIAIRTHSRLVVARVERVPAGHNTSRKEAPTLLQIVRDEALDDGEVK